MLALPRKSPDEDLIPARPRRSSPFDELLRSAGHVLFVRDMVWVPPVDVYETEREIIVKVELAGVGVADLEVTIDKDVLSIAGQRPDPSGLGSDVVQCVHHREIDCGRFERAIRLPARVDRQSIRAHLSDGYLDVVLQKETGRPAPYSVKVG